MPLIAEVFWKEPNVYDVAGVLGLVIGILSIWYAKRDIEKRIAEASDRASEAARDEVRRVARAVLQGSLANAARYLELSREAARGRQWVRAADWCNLAREQLTRFLAQLDIDDALAAEPRDVANALLGYLTALKSQPRIGAGELSDDVQQSLDEAILTLHRTDARVTALRIE